MIVGTVCTRVDAKVLRRLKVELVYEFGQLQGVLLDTVNNALTAAADELARKRGRRTAEAGPDAKMDPAPGPGLTPVEREP